MEKKYGTVYWSLERRNLFMAAGNKSDNQYKPKGTGLAIGIILFFLLLALILLLATLITHSSGDTQTTDNNSHGQITNQTLGTTDDAASTLLPVQTVQTGDENPVTTPDTTTPNQPIVAQEITVENEKVHFGNLILIDEDHSYKIGTNLLISRTEMAALSTSKLLSVYGFSRIDQGDSYTIKNNGLFLNAEALNAFKDMTDAFAEETGHKDVQVRNAYYYDSSEQVCYNCTGLYLDLQIMRSDGKIYPLNYHSLKEEYYNWFVENAHRFGYMLVRNVGDSYSTFRYVGVPHATYMKENNLDLESYLALLKKYTASSPLNITDSTGNHWMVYYTAVSSDEDSTTVTVFGDESCYTISGDNMNGLIVSVNTSLF
jgi:D-alanyl-D-alanine carboxypeptidase